MVLGLDGIIMGDFPNSSPFKANLDAANLKQGLQKALKDKNVKAVLLRLNSPGGTVGTSQEIYQLINRLKAAGKPVVSSMNDVCASGCYYIASASDAIVANRGTLTGSIGVVSQGFNVKGLYEKIGVKDRTFKAGKYKDLGNMASDMTAEERAIMQGILDDTYKQFKNDVATSRGIPASTMDDIAEGLIYTGTQAKTANLVDHLGTYYDAKNVLKKVLAEKYSYTGAEDIMFEEAWSRNKFADLESLFTLSTNFDLKSTLGRVSQSVFQPLWLMETN
jgi:protease-4